MSLTPLYELDEHMRNLVIQLQIDLHYDAKVICKREGGYGEIYKLQRAENVMPRFLAAKCPKIEGIDSKEKAFLAMMESLREVEKTYSLPDCPWANSFVDICLIYEWPFLISQWKDGTLCDLIANPPDWRLVDRLASLLQIVRVLCMGAERGMSAHQDLKPANIFFVDLRQKFIGISDSPGLHFQILVGDFGNADAFCDLEENVGTVPYMAPELFEKKIIKSSAGAAMDIFAVGVIAHECLCDGLHPIGASISDLRMRSTGTSIRKWSEERTWQDWAKQEKKDLDALKDRCPAALFSVISAALAADARKRPDPKKFEAVLWETLKDIDPKAYEVIQFQVKKMESMYAGSLSPKLNERLAFLRNACARVGKMAGLEIEDI